MERRVFGKKLFFYSLIIFLIIVFVILGLRFYYSSEDSWVKDSRGVYVKHGNPNFMLPEVEAQISLIESAVELYKSKKIAGMEFDSQCLGTIREYVVDIVHSPRTDEDNMQKNQCEDFLTGKVKHFIELDKDGNVVRIA